MGRSAREHADRTADSRARSCDSGPPTATPTAATYHASTDGSVWQLIRVFTLGADVSAHRIGFEAQSPTGEGCTVTFTDIRFADRRLAELRDGS